MSILSPNHPRFCAQYVKYLGMGTGNTRPIMVNFQKDTFKIKFNTSDLSVGDIVVVAKLRNVKKGYQKQWDFYCIRLAEDYWHYKRYESMTIKEKRVYEYKKIPKTWFGNKTYIMEKT